MKVKIILMIVVGIIGAVILMCVLFKNKHDPQEYAHSLLQHADIQINGDRPWDILVHNDNVYSRVIEQWSIGLGESYMDGWWDVPALDQFFFRLLNAQIDKRVSVNWDTVCMFIQSKLRNFQTKERAFQVGEQHYNLGNDLFEKMLDKNMIYSCGYWKHAHNLEQAQEHKLDLICKKLQLKPGMKLLDIGCGWGGLARYAAQYYQVEVTGITISTEQAEYAREFCKGLPVTIVLQDYRDVQEIFDRIVSVGMFEHVGYKNYKEFMLVAHRCLKDNGLLLLHTIGGNRSVSSGDAWITKYIFPNSMLPSMSQICNAFEGLFIMEDWHNFGADYDKTLMAWFERFDSNWEVLKSQYDERFYRMWKYYLLSCAGLFRARKAQLWQIVLSKHGVPGGYESVR